MRYRPLSKSGAEDLKLMYSMKLPVTIVRIDGEHGTKYRVVVVKNEFTPAHEAIRCQAWLDNMSFYIK